MYYHSDKMALNIEHDPTANFMCLDKHSKANLLRLSYVALCFANLLHFQIVKPSNWDNIIKVTFVFYIKRT